MLGQIKSLQISRRSVHYLQFHETIFKIYRIRGGDVNETWGRPFPTEGQYRLLKNKLEN